jgi:hypothetical protein
MTDRNKLKDRARDELFSHINRCGVLQAAEEEQKHWMDETMEYLGERYPDLTETDLRDLYTVGIRFCRPAIPHGRPSVAGAEAVEGNEANGVVESASSAEPAGVGAVEPASA